MPAARSSGARLPQDLDPSIDPNVLLDSVEPPPADGDSPAYFQLKLNSLDSNTWYEVCVIAINQRGSSPCGSDKELSAEEAFEGSFLVHTLSVGIEAVAGCFFGFT